MVQINERYNSQREISSLLPEKWAILLSVYFFKQNIIQCVFYVRIFQCTWWHLVVIAAHWADEVTTEVGQTSSQGWRVKGYWCRVAWPVVIRIPTAFCRREGGPKQVIHLESKSVLTAGPKPDAPFTSPAETRSMGDVLLNWEGCLYSCSSSDELCDWRNI